MANYGYVKTTETLTPIKITAALKRLNKRFKGNLRWKYEHADEPHAWGEHVWMLEYRSPVDDRVYAERVCWLDNERRFVMQHGGGSDFAWWIDSAILNEIALNHRGVIGDDGCAGWERGDASAYHSLFDYCRRLWRGDVHRLYEYLAMITTDFPPEFRDELVEAAR